MTNETKSETARVRFRVVAPIGREPSGARLVLTSDDYLDRFRSAFASLSVEVPDRIGVGPHRTVTWSPRALSDLTLAGVVRADATLSALSELAKKPVRGDGWLDELIAITGDGALARECRALLAPTPAAEPEAPAAAPAGADVVDEIFARAEVAARPASTSALDAFVGAMRRPGSGPTPGAAAPDVSRRVRDHLERAIFGAAREVLRHPVIARMESAWRALRWFVEQSPASSGVALEIFDAPGDRAHEILSGIPYDGDFEDPDLLAVVDRVDDLEALRELAQLAEDRMAPCIVTRAGEHDPDALIAWLDGGDPAARDAYAALRADEVSRWLCVAHNDAVLFEEGTGELSRIVLGSPVWALLTSIAASYRATGSFARIVGQDGQLRAPATTTIAIGRDAGTAIPTRHFASIRAQSDLEKHGVLALGSPRNSDRIALSSAPMVRASRDAVPLPAQMWAGRIARFTRWVKAQLPAGSSSDDARQIFEQAAAVFLYPGTERSARVTAEIVESSGSRTLRVGARVHGSMALVPLDLELEMPMA